MAVGPIVLALSFLFSFTQGTKSPTDNIPACDVMICTAPTFIIRNSFVYGRAEKLNGLKDQDRILYFYFASIHSSNTCFANISLIQGHLPKDPNYAVALFLQQHANLSEVILAGGVSENINRGLFDAVKIVVLSFNWGTQTFRGLGDLVQFLHPVGWIMSFFPHQYQHEADGMKLLKKQSSCSLVDKIITTFYNMSAREKLLKANNTAVIGDAREFSIIGDGRAHLSDITLIREFSWPKLMWLNLEDIAIRLIHLQEVLSKTHIKGMFLLSMQNVTLLNDGVLKLENEDIGAIFFSHVNLHAVQSYMIPRELLGATITYCNISFIASDSFLNKMSSLIKLDHNLISNVYNTSFSLNAEEIDLSHNVIGSLQRVIPWPKTLRTLILHHNMITKVNGIDLQGLDRLQNLDLSSNLIKVIALDQMLFHLEDLIDLDISSNGLERILGLNDVEMPQSLALNVSSNHLYRQDFSGSHKASPLSLTYLDASRNNFTLFPMQLLVYTNHLDLSNNDLSAASWKGTFPYLFRSHYTVDMTNNSIEDFPTGSFLYEKSALMRLMDNHKWDLTNNPLHCDCHAYPFFTTIKILYTQSAPQYLSTWKCSEPERLRGRPILSLSDLDFMCLSPNATDCPVKCKCYVYSYNQLIHVDCSASSLTMLPSKLPQNTYSFNGSRNNITSDVNLEIILCYPKMRMIDLSRNMMEKITQIFTCNQNKQLTLYLDKNKLTAIPEMLREFMFQEVYLGNSKFICDCENTWIYEWITKNQDYIPDVNEVVCTGGQLEGSIMLRVNTNQLKCGVLESTKAAIAAGIVALFVPLMIVLLYCYRGEIKVFMYYRFNWHPFDNPDDQDVLDKLYDVFLSYSHLDDDWVGEELLPRLENREQQYRTCLSVRDFQPSVSTSENVCNGVLFSRKMIMLLTQNFLTSEWCSLEFKAAHHKVLRDKTNYLIIILADDVRIGDLDEDLKLYLRTNTYIEWKSKWFWERLLYALPTTPLVTLRGQEMPEGGFGVLFPSNSIMNLTRLDYLARQQERDQEEVEQI